jgi:hypothetical protein
VTSNYARVRCEVGVGGRCASAGNYGEPSGFCIPSLPSTDKKIAKHIVPALNALKQVLLVRACVDRRPDIR